MRIFTPVISPSLSPQGYILNTFQKPQSGLGHVCYPGKLTIRSRSVSHPSSGSCGRVTLPTLGHAEPPWGAAEPRVPV